MLQHAAAWVVSCVCAVLGTLAAPRAECVELYRKGHFFKLYTSAFHGHEVFNDAGRPEPFDADGRGSFIETRLDYRYGVTDRLNVGVATRLARNSFENVHGTSRRTGLMDVEGVAEYRLLYLPYILSVRAGVAAPVGGDATHPLWLGNRTWDVMTGVTFKRLFDPPARKRRAIRSTVPPPAYTRAWLDADVAVRRVFKDHERNIDGRWSVPWRLSGSVRPAYAVTLSLAAFGGQSQLRSYGGVEVAVKYRFGTSPFELEAGLARLSWGRNSSAGLSAVAAMSMNTRRLWE
jgi:hypothetical protein